MLLTVLRRRPPPRPPCECSGTEIDLRYGNREEGNLLVVVAPVLRFKEIPIGANVNVTDLAPPENIIAGAWRRAVCRAMAPGLMSAAGGERCGRGPPSSRTGRGPQHLGVPRAARCRRPPAAGFAPELFGVPLQEGDLLDMQVRSFLCICRPSCEGAGRAPAWRPSAAEQAASWGLAGGAGAWRGRRSPASCAACAPHAPPEGLLSRRGQGPFAVAAP